MNNASLVLLDETLNYLNGNEMDRLVVMGAMMEQEATQFLNFTESTDIVLNEKFNAKELKEKAIKFIKTVIDKIKDFIIWIKDKVVGFFKAVKNRLKSGKSLKQLLSEVKSKATHESVSFVNEDAASNKAKLDEFLGEYVGIKSGWNPKFFIYVSQLIWRLYARQSAGIHRFEYYNNVGDIIKTEMGYSKEFVPDHKEDGITVKEFIEKDWESELEELCHYLETTNQKMIDEVKSKLKVFENKLAEISGCSDDEILNATSLKDLINNHNDDKKDEYENEIEYTGKFISLMTQYTSWANTYIVRCTKAVENNKKFLEDLKKEISGEKTDNNSKSVTRPLIVPAVTPARKKD